MKKKRVLFLVLTAVFVFLMIPVTAMAGDVMNFKIYLIDQNNNCMPGYIITVDNNTQTVTNGEGIGSFNGLALEDVDTFKLFTPDGKKQLGGFNLEYIPYENTSIGYYGDNYVLNYSTPDASVYMYWVYNPNAENPFHPAQASDNPLTPGPPKPAPAPTAKPSANPSAAPTAAPATNPQMVGYVVDEEGYAVQHAAITSKNNKTGGSVTATTDDDGYYVLPGISSGEHTITFLTEDGTYNDTLQFNVKVGDKTKIVKQSDELLELDVKSQSDVVYVNFMAGKDGNTDILEASNKVLPSPVTKDPQETHPPMPSIDPEPTVAPEPTVEPAPEPTAAPEPTVEPTVAPTEAPQPAGGLSDNVTMVLVVAVIAVAAVVIAVIVIRSRRRNY